MRNFNLPILRVDKRRYYANPIYPEIPLSSDDIYIITAAGERLDLLAYDYYDGRMEDYWIIAVANDLPGDSLFIEPGSQIRIPMRVEEIKELYELLNAEN